ncbi:hypothetical protein L198_07154 [Cryptococcus wingfieldii CBS 7118]|uniref:Uncharacterized protein n=1 Tax=Cryptococcus wingfieldii CBS 7118 TaxID=1295528 RepID=A0A1E3IHD5_9TREE|nr:hypothetical protein L198_07154 [Cryptococcus wingfieldii CBS 7118]ODN87151.1 hypothetical protein L198_07154 [Cryptococcus wingfieldii CBS 7118]
MFNAINHLRARVATLFAATPASFARESAVTEPVSHASHAGVSSERSVQVVPAGSVSAPAFVHSDDGIDVAVNHVFHAHDALTTSTHWVEDDYLMTVRKTTLLDEPARTCANRQSALSSASSSTSTALGQGRGAGIDNINITSATGTHADRQAQSRPSSGPAPRRRQLDFMNATHAPYPRGSTRVQVIARHREQIKVTSGAIRIPTANGSTRAVINGPRVSVAALCNALSGATPATATASSSRSVFAPDVIRRAESPVGSDRAIAIRPKPSFSSAPRVAPPARLSLRGPPPVRTILKRRINEVPNDDTESELARIPKRTRVTPPLQLVVSAPRQVSSSSSTSSSPASDIILTPPHQDVALPVDPPSPRCTKRTGDQVDEDADAQNESSSELPRVTKTIRFDTVPASAGDANYSRADTRTAFVSPPRAFLLGAPPFSPLPSHPVVPETETVTAQGTHATFAPPPRAFMVGAPPSTPLPCTSGRESFLARGAAAAPPPFFSRRAPAATAAALASSATSELY